MKVTCDRTNEVLYQLGQVASPRENSDCWRCEMTCSESIKMTIPRILRDRELSRGIANRDTRCYSE